MARRNISKKRFPTADPVYESYLVSLFVARILKKGKKSLAQRIVNDVFTIIKIKTNLEPLSIFEEAVKNVIPKIEVKSTRVAGSTYQVPSKISVFRGTDLALKWIIKGAKTRSGKHLITKLANEIIDASNMTGNAIRKREETHRMAKSNRTSAHLKY